MSEPLKINVPIDLLNNFINIDIPVNIENNICTSIKLEVPICLLNQLLEINIPKLIKLEPFNINISSNININKYKLLIIDDIAYI
jgi:hypothetical protein